MKDIIVNYRDTLIAACDKMLDMTYMIIEYSEGNSTEEELKEDEVYQSSKVSVKNYENVRKKLIENENLTTFDLNVAALACQGSAIQMDIEVEKLAKASKDLKEITKKIISQNLS